MKKLNKKKLSYYGINYNLTSIVYILLRKFFRKTIFLIISPQSKIINYFVKIDNFIRKFGVLNNVLDGILRYKNFIFYYDKKKDKSIASSILTTGSYENETLIELKKNLHKGSIFIDGGSNIGYFSIIASKIVGKKGKVISFEPTAQTYQNLIKNIKINSIKNIVPEQKAISSKNYKSFFKLCDNSEENSLIKKKMT